MESHFGPVPISLVVIEYSIINENLQNSKIFSNGNFTRNSPLVLCIFLSVNVNLWVYQNCLVTLQI